MAFNEVNTRIKEVHTDETDAADELHEIADKMEKLSLSFDRSLQDLRELPQTKPMKSNNWDSFREAFKGPVRIEINERN